MVGFSDVIVELNRLKKYFKESIVLGNVVQLWIVQKILFFGLFFIFSCI